MNYDDSIRWLQTLPDFERTGDFADRPDIAPMLALLRELGDPHKGDGAAASTRGASAPPQSSSSDEALGLAEDDSTRGALAPPQSSSSDPAVRRARRTIHIAGSKGKGSTGAILESILRAAGLRTGHYISPHLHRYNERIRIDGNPIPPEDFAAAMTTVRAALEVVKQRFPNRQLLAFDALTAAAFVAFREANVALQIIEVGLGGTLDSTNVFHNSRNPQQPASSDQRRPTTNHQPPITILTPISLEHTAILGDTIAAIARQKAGIITENSTVVVAPQRESALDVFTETARKRSATLIEVAKTCQMQRTSANADGQEFRLKTPRATYDKLRLPLAGRHQLDNAATAILAAEEFLAQSAPSHEADSNIEYPTSNIAAVKNGLASTKWPARLELLTRKPLLIIDGAHNGDSVKRMVAALRDDFGLKSAVLLFGTLADKDIAAMAEQAAPFATSVYVTAWPSARAADPRDLAAAFRPYDAPVTALSALAQAYEAALAEAVDRTAVVAFGALAFAAAVRERVLGIESDAVRSNRA